MTDRASSSHRLGFAVKVLGGGGLPSHDTRRWQSGPHLRVSLIGERRKRVGRRVERTPVLPQLRQHADLIDPFAFEAYLTTVLSGRAVDVMLEAKGKDLALLHLREHLAQRGFKWADGRLSAAAS